MSDIAAISRQRTADTESSVVRMSGVRYAWPGPRAFAISIRSFSVGSGERVLLLGPSGSGKSTLLNLLTGIAVPDEGVISILGTDIAKLGGAARDHFRADHFGIIFQMFNLLPYASVVDNVLLPLAFARQRRQRAGFGGGAREEARRLLAALGLDSTIEVDRPAANLSVGQQQRVAAARALIGRPEIIVADEPTSSLDRASQGAFLELLSAEMAEAGSSLVMVSHDESLGPRFDRVVRLDDIATSRVVRPA